MKGAGNAPAALLLLLLRAGVLLAACCCALSSAVAEAGAMAPLAPPPWRDTARAAVTGAVDVAPARIAGAQQQCAQQLALQGAQLQEEHALLHAQLLQEKDAQLQEKEAQLARLRAQPWQQRAPGAQLPPPAGRQLEAAAAAVAAAAVPAARRLAGACAGGTRAHADSDTDSSALLSDECAAWQAGYDEMGGGGIGWNKCGDIGMRADPCGCSGVKCVGGKITEVNLSNNGMVGVVPKSWSALTSLEKLYLDRNQLTGDLPAAWSALTSLKKLSLNSNQLTGDLPAAWSALTSLETLFLNSNQLTGDLPAAWSALTITHLNLYDNKLTGDLPAAWSALTSLTYLSLSFNKLTGDLPAGWSALTRIEHLYLHSNKLTGDLPAEWSALTSVTNLDLSSNLLTGEVPAAWKTLTSLATLGLRANGMTGVLAADLVPMLQGISGTTSRACQLEMNRFRCPLPAGLPSKCGATCCNANTFSKLGESECQACPNATNGASTEGADCFVCSCVGEPCAKGKYGLWTASANHTCETCPRGHFQDVLGAEGASSCKSCLVATGLKDADPGSDSKDDCVQILEGRFCDTGQESVLSSEVFGDCQNCTAGRFKEGNSTKPCQACPCGQWQDQPGQGVCDTKCAAGTIGSATTGKCEPCPDDSFCIGNQQTPFAKAARCIPGERELFAPNATSDRVCAPCAPGRYSNSVNARECSPCTNGFQPNSTSSFCTKHTTCAKGERVVAEPTATADRSCRPCAPGMVSATKNAAECQQCPAGTFQAEGGQATCTKHTVCAVGERVVAEPTATVDRSCQPCAAGAFSASKNAGSCEVCPGGAFQPEAGQASCTKHAVCVPGEFEQSIPSASSDRACALCAEGSFSNATNVGECAKCAPCDSGTRQQCGGGVAGFCLGCPAGQWFNPSAVECAACRAGFWCQGGKERPCGSANLFCPPSSSAPASVALGHYSVPAGAPEERRSGQAACEEGSTCLRGIRQLCPEGRVCQLTGSTEIFNGDSNAREVVNITAQARCDVGEFVDRGECLPCPRFGADCAEGKLTIQDGFWFDSAHGGLAEMWGKVRRGELPAATNIYRCTPGSCKANTTSNTPVCSEGRLGLLCGVCDDGYYATNQLACKPCADGSGTLTLVVGCLVLMLLAALALQLKRKIAAAHPRLAASLQEKLPEVLKLLAGLMQILSAFEAVLSSVPWPSLFSSVVGFFSTAVTLDIFALPSIRCSEFSSTYYARFDLHLATTLAITGALMLLVLFSYSSFNARLRRPLSHSLAWNILFPFLFIIYPSISRTVILMLRCRDVDGVSYLLSDISLSCETDEYAAHRNYAMFGVVVFPIGTVVFFLVLLWRVRKKLPPDWWPAEEPARARAAFEKYRRGTGRSMAKPFAAWKEADGWDRDMARYKKLLGRYGFLCSAYTVRLWWFESLLLVYRLAMTVLILFVSDDDEPKILFGSLGATLMLATISFFQPFKHPGILSINSASQLVILMVLMGAQYLLLQGGAGSFFALALVALTLAPLCAGVMLTLKLPQEAFGVSADDAMSKSIMGSVKQAMRKKGSRSESGSSDDGRGVVQFAQDNPMHGKQSGPNGSLVTGSGRGSDKAQY